MYFLALFPSLRIAKRAIRIHALPSLEGMEYMYFFPVVRGKQHLRQSPVSVSSE